MPFLARIAAGDTIADEPGEMRDDARESTESRFASLVLPHVSSAYNLARWLTRDDTDAQDVVGDAVLRAWKFFAGFRGGDARAWLLTIVRNCCATWRERNRIFSDAAPFDEEAHGTEESVDVEALAASRIDVRRLRAALEELPPHLREVVILREQEGFSYKEIAAIVEVPIGTVMSRLARARARLVAALSGARKTALAGEKGKRP